MKPVNDGYEDLYCVSILSAGILGITLVYVFQRRRANLPPGPRGIPFLGYAPFLGSHGAESLRKLKGNYGPVMSVQLGMDTWVVLNDYETIKECLVKQGEKFSGRPKNQILDKIAWGKGIVFLDYNIKWKRLRKFGSMTLRGFGVGKKGMEQHVIEETPYLIEELIKDNEGHSIKLTNAISNIICRVTFGSRFDYSDKKFSQLTRIFRDMYSHNTDSKLAGIMMAVPILQYLPIFRGAMTRIMEKIDALSSILKDIINEHQMTFDRADIRDFIDAFLDEMHDRDSDDDVFNETQLLCYIRDLFEAATVTTSSTLTWGLLALVNHPDCQKRMADEIHRTIGDSGLPSMKNQDEMDYTCAFIQELMRHRTLTPTSVMHKTTESANVCGYSIPKDTPVITNIWSVHHDPNLFENPEVFEPERFLDSDGKFVKSNHVIPFSVGPRHCLGEQLGRMEVFIFLTGIVQKLKVLPDPAHPPPPLDSTPLIFLSTYEPPEFRVVFERR